MSATKNQAAPKWLKWLPDFTPLCDEMSENAEVHESERPPPAPTVDIHSVLVQAHAQKDLGNRLFQAKAYKDASQAYNSVIELLGLRDSSVWTPEQLADLEQLATSCYLNHAQCELIQRNYRSCIASAKGALDLDPDNVKAYFRIGKAYAELGELPIALQNFQQAHDLAPTNKTVAKALKQCRNAQKTHRNKQSALGKVLVKHDAPSNKSLVRSQVYLEFRGVDGARGRVIIELFDDLVPKSARNFRQLCSGEAMTAEAPFRLHYKGGSLAQSRCGPPWRASQLLFFAAPRM